MTDRFQKKCIVWILVVAFACGLAVSTHYGTYYDQYIEEGICMMNIAEYANRILHTDWDSISDSEEKDHGTALYYPVGALELVAGQTPATSAVWHCWTFVLFFAGCLALYGIMCRLFLNRWLSLAVFGLLYLSPRFFAEGHYNNKDVVLMALGLIVIYFGMCYMDGRQLRHGLAFAVAAAFMTNLKIIGAWFFAVIGIAYLARNIHDKKLNARKVAEGFGVIAAFLTVYALITPAIWKDPVEFVSYNVVNASTFARWTGTVRYAGRTLEVPLPADYLPLQILYTTPLVLLGLAFAGQLIALVSIARRDGKALYYGMFFLLYLVPFVYALADRELVVYNGWRHFYFIYGPLAVFMGTACEWIARGVKDVRLSAGMMGGVLVYLLALTVIGHPYQYSYINSLAARPAQDDWQLDYWCVGGLSALDLLYESDGRNPEYELTVSGEGTLKADMERFAARWNHEMRYVEAADGRADDDAAANYVVRNLTYDRAPEEGYHLLFATEAYGNRLYEVYERD